MDLSGVERLLFTLDKSVFLINFVLLLIAILLEKKVSSLVISLLVLVLANGLMTSLSPLIFDIARQPDIGFKFVWYGGFALIDCLAVFLLYKFHLMLKQNVSLIANIVGLVFLILATLQTIRFVDRLVLELDWLASVYRLSIPLLNVGLIPVIIILWLLNYRPQRSVKA